MIVVKIHSGLGNQMFQYAFALSLAIKHKTTLHIDASYPQYYPIEAGNRKQFYHLNLFNIQKSDFFTLPLVRFRNWFIPKRMLKKIYFSSLSYTLNKLNLVWIKDDLSAGQDAYSQLPDNCYLDGYFQYPDYFEAIKSELKAQFIFNKPPINTRDEEAILNSEVSVGVNLRRGDYLKPANLENIGICTLEYYASSIAYILKDFPKAKLFVLSDDIPDARQFLEPLKLDLHYLNADSNKHILSDMYLLQQCDHLILANSTYSWWSAYLRDDNPINTVIAPDKWFVNPAWSVNNAGITPKSWIRMPN